MGTVSLLSRFWCGTQMTKNPPHQAVPRDRVPAPGARGPRIETKETPSPSRQREVGVAALPSAVAIGVDEDRAGDRKRRDAGTIPSILLIAAGLLERQRGVAIGGHA